jgi:predicted phosphodiesterase
MKLHILSDLHLTVGPLEGAANEADAVILAGDVARPKEAVAWALRFAKPVFYVAGNHEFLRRQHPWHSGRAQTLVRPDRHPCARQI